MDFDFQNLTLSQARSITPEQAIEALKFTPVNVDENTYVYIAEDGERLYLESIEKRDRYGEPADEFMCIGYALDLMAETDMTIRQASDWLGVSEQAIRDILRNETRRAIIFPSARKFGSKRGGIWMIQFADVQAWQPRNYPR